MSNKNRQNSLMDCLMARSVLVSVLVATFVLMSLASSAIAASGEVLVLHFDEGSGTIARDASGNGNDGTIYGATWTDGISGKALRFDGVDDYVDCGSPANLNFRADALSIEAWVKTTDTTNSWKGIVGKWSATNNNGYFLQYLPYTNEWAFGWHGKTFLNPTKSISDGNWHHVVGKRIGSTSAELYIDGELIGTRSDLLSISSDTTDPLSVGRLSPIRYSERYFNGIIDEVRIYNRALSAEEIKANYEGKQPATPTPTPTPAPTPSKLDSDGDGWSDEKEESMGTNPYSVDSDKDGINDPQDPNPTVPDEEKGLPGFEVVFAIAGLLAVAYLVQRGRK